MLLVQERNVRHRATLGLGVHDDPMPERQRNGSMIAVAHSTAGIDTHVAAHDAPALVSSLPIAPQDQLVFILHHAVRLAPANVNSLAAAAIELLHNVWLASTATDRLVAENEFLVHHEGRFRHEEPLALTAKCAVLARVAFA